MPLTRDQLAYIEATQHSSGLTLTCERPHQFLQQLEAACAANDLPTVQNILTELGPLPPDPPIAARVSIAKALRSATTSPVPPSSSGERPVLQALLAHGLALRYEYSCLAVDEALWRRDLSLLQAFMDGGWDVNETGRRRRPALRYALLDEAADLRAWLLEQGADPNLEDERRVTPLEIAAQGWAPVSVLRELLTRGGNPSRMGDESLLLAAEQGDLERAKILIDAGAHVNGKEKEGGPRDFAPQRRGRTVLNAAIEYGREDMVRLLLERGASPDQRDEGGRTAMDVARRMKMDRIVTILGG